MRKHNRRRRAVQSCSTKMDFLLMRKLERDPAGLLAMLTAPKKSRRNRKKLE